MKACYNCNQSGHMSRECPEPRKETRGGRGGGFNSGTSDRNSGFQSSNNGGNTFRTMQEIKMIMIKVIIVDQNQLLVGGEEVQRIMTQTKANKRPTFDSSSTRGSFNNNGGGFRGNQVCQLIYMKNKCFSNRWSRRWI